MLSRGAGPVALLLVAVATAAATAGAAEPPDDWKTVARLRARSLAAEGRCEDALAVLEEQRPLDDARALLVAGQCWMELGQPARAVVDLERARELDPRLTELDLDLGVARYHAGDYEGAGEALSRARGRTASEAQLELYTGLLLLRRADLREAAASLERARRADAEAVEPVASYYAALAWKGLDEEEKARRALERVRELDREGTWAQRAEEALREPRFGPRFWGSLRAGLEYDTNVVLRGGGPTFPGEITDEDDGRAVWTASGGAELLRTKSWSGGLLASYYGSAHFDLTDFDTHYPTASAWIDRRLGDDTTARLRYDFGYAWIDTDPFLLSHDGSAALYRSWGRAGESELTFGFLWYNFLFGLGGNAALNRDGVGPYADLEHRVPLGLGDAILRAGYRFRYYRARGSEYDYTAHQGRLGFEVTLPGGVGLDALGAFTHQPFENASFFGSGGEDREDEIWEAVVVLERALSQHVSVSARYHFEDHDSNAPVFDYDRHIVGGYVTVSVP